MSLVLPAQCPLAPQDAWNLVQEFQALVNTLAMGFSAQEAQVGKLIGIMAQVSQGE